MPRRALRKIGNPVDISRHYLNVETIPEVLNAETLFGKNAPLELEIGSGKGLFIRKAAAQYPGHLFLGIEIADKYTRLCANNIAKYGLENAKMLCADAALILEKNVPENSLHAVHIYFPDPWWKRRHRKRRIVREEVVRLVESRLVSGGTLHFWTDVKEYFDSGIEIIRENTKLDGPHFVPEPDSLDPDDSRTHFERRTRLNSLPVYRSFFKK